MAAGVMYYRRESDRTQASARIGDVFGNWSPGGERWLFLAAHDDDIIAGGGLTFLAALAEGIEVHAVITTDGRMGYCRPEQRDTIAAVRQAEARASFQILGLPPQRLHFLHFPDCELHPYRGRRFTATGDPAEIAGATGLQNSYCYMIRQVRPTRVFLPTITDLHPDHRIVHEEMMISLFHAQGNIWPELGAPVAAVPELYEYATYCGFCEPPQICITGPAAMLETKLRGIRAYASQEQIELLIDLQRGAGPIEYLREVKFQFYSPQQYAGLFDLSGGQ
jgi:LmbE family N-acetylglucosaminyl deacetylase